jgi:hypothetical protein
MSGKALEDGYRRAYRDFYRWRAIARGTRAHDSVVNGLRHFAYAAGWKKFEPLWDAVIRAKQVGSMLPVLETLLGTARTSGHGGTPSAQSPVCGVSAFPRHPIRT